MEALAIRTQWKLRLLSRWNWIYYRIEGNTKRLLEQTRADSYRQGYQMGLADGKSGNFPESPGAEYLTVPILSLPLSNRIHNALARAGFSTLEELAVLDEYQIIGIPGLGRKNVKTLARILVDYGLSGTAWERFLRP